MSVRRPEGESTVHKLLNESDPGPGFRGRSDTIAKRMVTELDMELGEGNPIRYDCLLVSENGLAAFDRKRIFPDNERYAVFPGSSGMAEESLRQCYGELSWLKGGVPSESDLAVLAAYAVEGRGVAGYGKDWEPDERTRVRMMRRDGSGRFSQTAVKGKALKDYVAAHLPDFSQPPRPRPRADASQLFGGRKVCEVAALQPRYAEQPAEWEPLRQGK